VARLAPLTWSDGADSDKLHPELLDAIEDLSIALNSAAPTVALHIVSGYRSPARQAELRRAWDRGLRSGLVARPAVRSQHTRGRAVDVQLRHLGPPEWGQLVTVADTPFEWWQVLAEWLSAYGVAWGGAADPNHFELAG
jgi:D-alanyl-D-alanine dipeptidase